jgi:chromate transport protein ChrA
MLLPKFTLAQTLRLTLLAACCSVVLAAAWQNQAWARGLSLAAGLSIAVALFAAAFYWLILALGLLLVRGGQSRQQRSA